MGEAEHTEKDYDQRSHEIQEPFILLPAFSSISQKENRLYNVDLTAARNGALFIKIQSNIKTQSISAFLPLCIIAHYPPIIKGYEFFSAFCHTFIITIVKNSGQFII